MPSKPGQFRQYAEALRRAAAKQAGFFTAAQARAAGYADSVHAYHVVHGDWIKVLRGIYRLAALPAPARPELHAFLLWSRDRAGRPQGVFTHATAREIHRLDPPGPGPVHLTVPRTFRKNTAPPDGLVLHKQNLDPDAWETTPDGLPVLKKNFCGQPTPTHPARHPYDTIIQRGED